MGKRKTISEIKGNSIDGNGNVVTINNNIPTPPPILQASVFDILQSKEAEIRKLENENYLLLCHIQQLTSELKEVRELVSDKNSYINSLLLRRA